MVDKKYIVDIKGKKFITYAGLLNEAHKQKIEDMRVTELNVNWDNQSAYCIVACKIGEKEFMGVGSGTQENCGSMVKGHFVEMAHTRAKARALRDALNIDMVAVDELKSGSFGKDTEVPNKCSGCDKDISDAEKEFSIKFHNKTLCMDCQKKNKKV